MSVSVFAGRATIGAHYVTRGGWPITVREIGDRVIVKNDLTGETHRLDKGHLLWPYDERLVSKEAIDMARAKGHKKHAGKKVAKKTPRAVTAAIADGTMLVREYKGKTHNVEQLSEGYRYNGEDFKSLTAIAKKITGYPSISGPAFFAARAGQAAPVTEPSVETQAA